MAVKSHSIEMYKCYPADPKTQIINNERNEENF